MPWPREKLGTLLKIRNGFAFDSAGFTTSGGLPLIRIRDLKDGRTTQTNYDGPYEREFEVAAGDLLIGMDGEFACYEWFGEAALLNQRVCKLYDFSSRLYPRYVLYGINSYLRDIEDRTGFTTVKHLSSKQIASIDFPVPSLSEQKRIVAILDKAFEGIRIATANAEKNLANVDELFASELDRIVLSANGRKARLREITDRVSVGHVGITSPYYRDTGVLFLRTQNVTSSGLVFDDVKFITPEFHAKLTKSSLQKGDVLISRVITDRISCGVMPAGMGPANCANVILVRPGKRILPEYLQQVIRARSTQQFLLSKKVGSAQSVVNTSVLQELDITLPTLDDQAMLLSKIERVASGARILDETYRVQAASHEQLKQSILYRAFSGQLTATKGLAA